MPKTVKKLFDAFWLGVLEGFELIGLIFLASTMFVIGLLATILMIVLQATPWLIIAAVAFLLARAL